MSKVEAQYFFPPASWAEKLIRLLLHESGMQPGKEYGRASLFAQLARVEYDANAPDDPDVGRIEICVCVVPPKFSAGLRELILAERADLPAKEWE